MSAAPPAATAAPQADAPGEATASPWPASSARVIDDCLWYADSSAPPLQGAGSMAELDQRISAELSRRASVVGRIRLSARGCPRVSAGIALGADPDAEDPDYAISILGWDGSAPPRAGERGDERRDAPFQSAGDLSGGDSECDSVAGLYVFRALHARDGSVQELALAKIGDTCTLLAHDLEHGDLDRDGTTEIRARTWTSGELDMSAGADRWDRLHIFDLAELRTQVVLTLGRFEAAEVDGYGSTDTRGEIALRDLDDDGDRDIILRRRGTSSERSLDDMDEIFHGEWVSEAYSYDPTRDEWTRASSLDARIPGRRR